MDTTRNSENPSSLYDPAVALEFFQFAGKPQKIAKGTTLFSENRKGMPLLLLPNRIYLLLEGEVGIHAGRDDGEVEKDLVGRVAALQPRLEFEV